MHAIHLNVASVTINLYTVLMHFIINVFLASSERKNTLYEFLLVYAFKEGS